MAGRMGELDSGGVLAQVSEPSLADQCRAVWVLVGAAASDLRRPLTQESRRDVREVASMLDVTVSDVLLNRPRRRRRQRVHVREPR